MGPKLKVVQFPRGSPETVRILEQMLQEARDGRLIGLAYVAMYHHNDYGLGIKGETRRAPIITRGMLPELDHLLAQIIRG